MSFWGRWRGGCGTKGYAQGVDVAAESEKRKLQTARLKGRLHLAKSYLWLCWMALSYTNERFHLGLKLSLSDIFIRKAVHWKRDAILT